jgi:hypothetical protein
MNSHLLKLILLSCIIIQVSCGITFKRKSVNNEDAMVETSKSMDATQKIVSRALFSKKDTETIALYYSDLANEIIRRGMIRHTTLSKKQKKNLTAGKFIPVDIQVIPLPLTLERTLSSLSLHYLRVQVGTYVILMNAKSRKILDIITI